jgi:coenzyme F420-reducing hydrogenase alpha subunit
MLSLPEFRFYQGILDDLDFGWLPQTYYTLAYGEKVPSYSVSEEIQDALEPFVGEVVSEMAERNMQSRINDILNARTMRREILIWTNFEARPMVIDSARVVRDGDCCYRVAPILDRTDIMREVIEKLEQGS